MAISLINEKYMDNYISEMKNSEHGIKTGIIDLDHVIGGGLKKGCLYIIGGRPSMGKTSFALNLCRGIAENGDEKVLYYSMEMTTNQLISRYICMHEQQNYSKIRKPDDETFRKMTDFSKWISQKHFYVDDSAAKNVFEIKSDLEKDIIGDLDVIVVDYLQLMTVGSMEDLFSTRQSRIEYLCMMLKDIAIKYNVAVIVLSQLGRAPEQRADHRPILSDLKDFRAIEVYADVVMMLYRDKYYYMETALKDTAEVILVKNNYGTTGAIRLAWIPEFMIFENIEGGI